MAWALLLKLQKMQVKRRRLIWKAGGEDKSGEWPRPCLSYLVKFLSLLCKKRRCRFSVTKLKMLDKEPNQIPLLLIINFANC